MKRLGVLKRALSLTLAFLFLTMMLATAFAASKSYYVNCDKLYVRSGPGTGYSVVKTLKRNAVVTKTGHDGGWWHVKYSGGSGYVYKTYLSTVKSSSSGSSYKTTAQLRMRSSASISCAVIKTLKKGAKVTLKKTKGSWAYVTSGGKTGWVATKYLKRV